MNTKAKTQIDGIEEYVIERTGQGRCMICGADFQIGEIALSDRGYDVHQTCPQAQPRQAPRRRPTYRQATQQLRSVGSANDMYALLDNLGIR
jgi:hypothetical protein